ncbi:hypothetical protein TNIN_105671 [Trichonephila inaurata madagascariensis]|uniref:Uncharacterized protein n=1 Tax=Trichonephila inaurata madagascariensis TaxID=2747483 RepID=A0A8X6YWN5_9ARAC|nr:hypothetical protein TNIN_105671 [Trichonephila inaurata madagascariensis]
MYGFKSRKNIDFPSLDPIKTCINVRAGVLNGSSPVRPDYLRRLCGDSSQCEAGYFREARRAAENDGSSTAGPHWQSSAANCNLDAAVE